jgi:gentisate 1,2-dioxygenase
MTTDVAAAETKLYKDFAANGLVPLWHLREDLMPMAPKPQAVAHIWHWSDLYSLAQRAGDLVPVGRGGERRAIAISNPGLGGAPYATPTLWAAIQYLGGGELAPAHRHSQNAFRFVLEGQGVWTVVDGDPVFMSQGDLLLTAGWQFHSHHNPNDIPMAWLDGLDIPLVDYIGAGFFEFGEEELADFSTPKRARAERLWGNPGLLPVSTINDELPYSPMAAYRWKHTDSALAAQLELETDGYPGVVSAGHAAVRFSNPATGGDALPTIRTEMHRLREGASTERITEAGSSVWQVFAGGGTITLENNAHVITRGDLIAVPSWCTTEITADDELTLFRMSDAPLFERLHLDRRITS